MNKKGQSFQQTFYNFMLLAVVVLAMLSYTFIIQDDNDAAQPLAQNDLFNGTAARLGANLTNAENASQIQQGIFSDEKPQSGFGSIVLFGIVSAGKTFTTLVYDIFGAIFRVPMIVLGIDSQIVSTIISILIITLIIGVWIVYKLGG